MSKDFSEQLADSIPAIQPAPADVLMRISENEKEKQDEIFQEKLREKTEETMNNVMTVIETFQKLDPYFQDWTLARINGIARHREGISETIKENLNIEEAASYLKVSERTIRNYLSNKKVSGEKVNGRWQIPRKELDKLKK